MVENHQVKNNWQLYKSDSNGMSAGEFVRKPIRKHLFLYQKLNMLTDAHFTQDI